MSICKFGACALIAASDPAPWVLAAPTSEQEVAECHGAHIAAITLPGSKALLQRDLSATKSCMRFVSGDPTVTVQLSDMVCRPPQLSVLLGLKGVLPDCFEPEIGAMLDCAVDKEPLTHKLSACVKAGMALGKATTVAIEHKTPLTLPTTTMTHLSVDFSWNTALTGSTGSTRRRRLPFQDPESAKCVQLAVKHTARKWQAACRAVTQSLKAAKLVEKPVQGDDEARSTENVAAALPDLAASTNHASSSCSTNSAGMVEASQVPAAKTGRFSSLSRLATTLGLRSSWQLRQGSRAASGVTSTAIRVPGGPCPYHCDCCRSLSPEQQLQLAHEMGLL
jgi:hypothetical protein